jgi:branched-subunit amino acid ABC-type transport system permease component
MDILPQLLVNSLITGSVYALVAVGFALTYGVLKILNFAHGHLLMAGAYLFYLFSVQLDLPLPLAALSTAGSALLLALITLAVFITPFQRYSTLLPLVTTLAFATILESVVSMVFGVNVKSLDSGEAAISIEIGSIFITPLQLIIIGSALIILIGIAFLIHSTSFGRRVRAMAELQSAAQAIAVDTPHTTAIVFAMSVLLAVYAGVMVGYETNLQPTMGHGYTMKALAAMILGGLGNLWGTILGCYIVGTVENLAIGLDLGRFSLPAGYKDAFAYCVILLVLLIRPEGLLSWRRRTA